MKKIFSFLYLLIIVNLAAFSQQDPQFTNFMEYKLGVNPGFAGTDGTINGLILNRYQWAGTESAIKTLVFSANASVKAFGADGGVGLNVVSDEIGFGKVSQINVNYAYIRALSFGNLGIGLSLGLFNQSINGEWEVPEGDLYTQPGSDPAIPQGDVSQMATDIGFGMYLKSNKYFWGASVTHINQSSITYDEVENYFLVRHYYLMGGYNIKLSDPLFVLQPSFLFKSDLAGWQMDLNTNIVFDERILGGITYRYRESVALLLGLEMESGLRFGYSFDLVTSAVGRGGFGSHEIYVSYSLDLERNRTQKYKSIRFL